MIETELMRVGNWAGDDKGNHYLTILRKESYTTEELVDIADTIKSYAQDADLIERLY